MASEERPITLVLADDDARFVRALASLFEQDRRFRVVAEAYHGAEAVDVVVVHRPELVILDVAMPVLSGLEATRLIRVEAPARTVVLLSSAGLSCRTWLSRRRLLGRRRLWPRTGAALILPTWPPH